MSELVGVIEVLAQGSAALLTPLIGFHIATEYHRRREWSRRDREHLLFKRRHHVYTRLMGVLAEIIACRIGQAPRAVEDLSGIVAEATFLFSVELEKEFEILSERTFEYMELNHELNVFGPDEDGTLDEKRRNALVDALRDHRRWFLETRRRLGPMFHDEMRRHHDRLTG